MSTIQSVVSVPPFVHPNTTVLTHYADIPMKVILAEAKERVASHISRTRDNVDHLDLSRMVIQEEFGHLIYTKGDVSFLIPNAPIFDHAIRSQLGPDVNPEYDDRQLAVWKKLLRDGKQFRVAPKWKAAILPFLAGDNELLNEFTVTVFIPRKK